MGEAVKIIYRGTAAGSPARRLMVNFHVGHGTTQWFDSTCEAGFVRDVLQSLYDRMPQHSSISQMRGGGLSASDYVS